MSPAGDLLVLTLQHASVPVQMIAIVGLPERRRHDAYEPAPSPTWDAEPFHPSPEDQAYEMGYQLGRDGDGDHTIRCPFACAALSWQFVLGRARGRQAREVAEARALGYELGLLEGPSEAPGGYSTPEDQAYREGYAVGIGVVEGIAEADAWLDLVHDEAMARHFSTELSDADVYPLGCVS